MRKLLRIARHEYIKVAGKRSFIISTIGFPLFFIAVMAFSIFMAVGSEDSRPLGVVDEAGVLAANVAPTERANGDKLVEVRRFADEAAAQAALRQGDIQAYYLLPAGYLSGDTVRLYYWDKTPATVTQRDFDYYLRANLVASLSAEVRERALAGPVVTARSADGQQEISGDGFLNFLLPFGIGFFFLIAVMSGGGYLLQAVTDEKENRTVEVMTTSVSPNQLIFGKALGLIAVALTQLLILLIVIVVGLAVGARFVDALQELRMPWPLLLIIVAFFLPSYTLIAGMMIAVGAAVTELRQGQQIVGALNMLFTLPYFFVIVFFTAPNSPLATLLTLFPTTAFITITMRWGMSTIPAWQIIASWLILVLSSVGMIWAAARVFRAGMLLYGQRLNFKAMLRAIGARAG